MNKIKAFFVFLFLFFCLNVVPAYAMPKNEDMHSFEKSYILISVYPYEGGKMISLTLNKKGSSSEVWRRSIEDRPDKDLICKMNEQVIMSGSDYYYKVKKVSGKLSQCYHELKIGLVSDENRLLALQYEDYIFKLLREAPKVSCEGLLKK